MSDNVEASGMEEITAKEDILLRQINPTFIQSGRIGSQSFKPFPRDDGYLSVHEKDKITPKEAHRIFTEIKGFNSENVAGVSISEVNSIDLQAYSDQSEDGPSPEADALDDAHASINFNELEKSDIKSKSKTLSRLANDRGFLL